MSLDEVGGEQAGGSATGTGSPISNAGAGPAGGESSGAEAGSPATTGDAAGSALAVGLSGASRIGWGIAAGGVNGARAVANAFKNMLMKVWSAALPGGAAISSFTGGLVSQKAGAAGMLGGGGLAGAVLTAVIASMFVVPGSAIYGGDMKECKVDAPSEGSKLFTGSEEMEESAKKVYGALSGLGMGDENIAGILGNFQTESGVDPTAVEHGSIISFHDEAFSIGPKKKDAEENNFSGAYIGKPVTHVGIGLGQWTNERGVGLREFANSQNHDWWDMNLQLAYAISKDSGAPIFKEMVENKSPGSDNAQDAASHFLKKWEVPQDIPGNDPIRRQQASAWFAKMGGWEKDQQAADSILDMAEAEGSIANNRSKRQEQVKCSKNTSSGGNSDAARAMATFSFSSQEKSWKKDGTYMYIWLHDEIFKGDPYYASCDRGVATAVRWSGTDDSAKYAGTSEQYSYYLGSDKWEEVTGWETGEANPDVLEPGDVFVNNGKHTEMWLGREVMEEVWGSEVPDDYTMASASCFERSPNVHAWDVGPGSNYKVFRIRKPEEDSEFKKLDPPSNHERDTGPDQFVTPPCPG